MHRSARRPLTQTKSQGDTTPAEDYIGLALYGLVIILLENYIVVIQFRCEHSV